MVTQLPFRLDRAETALMIIDVQYGFDLIERRGVARNNPDALSAIVELLEAFRSFRVSIYHVRHSSTDPNSPFWPTSPGFAVKDEVRELPGESVVVKRVNSAFIGTDLEVRLRQSGVQSLVICGATTNHCVETTTRMAGNLGFTPWLARDACWTYDRRGPDGESHSADELHAVTLANLNGEFARIASTVQMIDGLAM